MTESELQSRLRGILDSIEALEQYPTTFLVIGIIIGYLIIETLTVSLTLGIRIMIFAIGAYGVHLLYGYTGLLSFGHAAFFGIGAYAVTIVLSDYGFPVMPAILVAMIVAIVFAFVIGYLSIQQFGIYFAILTLAFAEFLRFVAQQLDITGGFQGITGLFRRPEVGVGPLSLNLNNMEELFAFVAIMLVLTVFLMQRLLQSQLGTAFIAIRENQERAEALGYNVQRLKLISFVISGAVTGIAGALWGINIAAVSPEALHWSISGEFIFMIILGGVHQLLGPIIGATMFFALEELFGMFTDRRFLFVGILLIVLVLYAPDGLWPNIKKQLGKLTRE